MPEFLARIAICLIIAAAIGFAVAWTLRGMALRRLHDQIAQLRSEHDAVLGSLSRQTGELRAHELAAARLEARIAEAREEAQTERRHVAAADVRRRELEALDEHHRLKIDALYRDLATRSTALEELRHRVASAEAALAQRTAELASADGVAPRQPAGGATPASRSGALAD